MLSGSFIFYFFNFFVVNTVAALLTSFIVDFCLFLLQDVDSIVFGRGDPLYKEGSSMVLGSTPARVPGLRIADSDSSLNLTVTIVAKHGYKIFFLAAQNMFSLSFQVL